MKKTAEIFHLPLFSRPLATRNISYTKLQMVGIAIFFILANFIYQLADLFCALSSSLSDLQFIP
jgi:hypothetical protein